MRRRSYLNFNLTTSKDFYLRNGSTISDLQMLVAISLLKDLDVNPDKQNLGSLFQIHPNRIAAKIKRMEKRNLVDGCTCPCGTSTVMTDAGLAKYHEFQLWVGTMLDLPLPLNEVQKKAIIWPLPL